MSETPTETPPENAQEGFNAEFKRRVEAILPALENDPKKMARAMAEVHTLLFMFDEGFRAMQNEMQNAGPAGFLKMMMGRS